jgi:hypothetical protein
MHSRTGEAHSRSTVYPASPLHRLGSARASVDPPRLHSVESSSSGRRRCPSDALLLDTRHHQPRSEPIRYLLLDQDAVQNET